jgi:hypothetical protein
VGWNSEDLMSEEDGLDRTKGYTRRSFLGKVSLGLAALAGSGLLLRNFFSSGNEATTNEELPGEDSIFHPRQDVVERHRNSQV